MTVLFASSSRQSSEIHWRGGRPETERREEKAVSESNNNAVEISALTIHQPYAGMIFVPHTARKAIENRTWKVPQERLPMPMAVHASAMRMAGDGAKGLCARLAELLGLNPSVMEAVIDVHQAVLGIVTVTAVEVFSDVHAGDIWATGPYCWRLERPELLLGGPWRCRGRQGLWRLELPVEKVPPVYRHLLEKGR